MKEKFIKKIKRKMPIALSLLCILNFFFTEKTIALTQPAVIINFTDDSKLPFSGFDFSLYKIADPATDQTLTLCPPFSAYPITLPEENTSSLWEDLALTLKGYISRDRIKEIDKQSTDESGNAVFSSDSVPLEEGLYLLLASPVTLGNKSIEPQASFFNLSKEDDEPLLIKPKYSATPVPANPPETIPAEDKKADSFPKKGKLPQAGVLWYPLFISSVMGLFLLSLGLYLRRKGGDK